jgi:hypothetical protein
VADYRIDVYWRELDSTWGFTVVRGSELVKEGRRPFRWWARRAAIDAMLNERYRRLQDTRNRRRDLTYEVELDD